MYSITVINSTGEYPLFNSFDDDIKVVNPILSLELNKSGTLTFDIPASHPNVSQILPLASEIYVYSDEAVYWVGRPLTIEGSMDLMQTVTCEGILGYLLDTKVPPFDFTEGNSIKGADCVRTFLNRLINSHNSRLTSNWVDSRKKFVVGTVDIYDTNQNLARSSEDYHNTLETINEKLLNTTLGGFITVRIASNGTRYIDYLSTFGHAQQPITFGTNLLDLATHVDTDTIYTVVVPLGAEVGDTGKRLDLLNYSPTTSAQNQIASRTHGGRKYNTGSYGNFASMGAIYDAEGVQRHGRVFTELVFDDITTQYNLAMKAADYIGTVSVLGEVLELSAVDLSSIDVDFNRFNVGEFATVVSIPHGINAEYQITQMQVDLFNPANSGMTLGGEVRSFTFDNTKQTIEFNERMSNEVSTAVQNATALLSGGLGGYLYIKRDENDQPYEILIMNAATEQSATYCVRMNRNGIGFGSKRAGQSASSWTYRNAWTIDGSLVADFITTGTLKDAYNNVNFNLNTGTLNMKQGSINLGGGMFTVNNSGYLVAKNIDLGGFKLTNGIDGRFALCADNGAYRTWIRTATSSSGADTWALSVQQSVNGAYRGNFYVTSGGEMNVRPFGGDRLDVGRDGTYIRYGAYILGLDSEGFYASYSGTDRIAADKDGVYFRYGSYYYGMDSDGVDIHSTNCSLTMGSSSTTLQSATGRITANASGLTIVTGRSTSDHSGNLYLSTSGTAYFALEGTSSRKIKKDIKPVENPELDPANLYNAEVIQFKYRDEELDPDDTNIGRDLVGFIVEDLDEAYPAAVQKEDPEESKTWTWSPYRIIPPMLKLIQDQKKQIDSLEDRLTKLEAIVDKLKGENNG